MTASDPRLAYLVHAAKKLIDEGGTIVNRNRLAKALLEIPSELDGLEIVRPLTPTPAVIDLIKRASDLANASNDLHLRLQHIDWALKETPITQ